MNTIFKHERKVFGQLQRYVFFCSRYKFLLKSLKMPTKKRIDGKHLFADFFIFAKLITFC